MKTLHFIVSIGIIMLFTSACGHSPKEASLIDSPDLDSSSTKSGLSSHELSSETPQWEVIDINGSPAIKADFHSDKYGILQIAYSPERGFRCGLLDDSHLSKLKDGMMLGYLTKGEEFARLIIPDNNDGQYMYFDAPSLVAAINSGDVESLTIERMNDDCSKDESVDYSWHVRFRPDELKAAFLEKCY